MTRNRILTAFVGLSTLLSPALLITPAFADAPTWDVSGSYTIAIEHNGVDYLHDVTLAQDGLGNLTGNGGSPAGSNVYEWSLTSGAVTENTFMFAANYTATPDAVTPQTVMNVTGAVANNGTLSGTWSDNYNGGQRSGTWESTTGTATPIVVTPPQEPHTVTVTVEKFINGTMATAATADNADFPMVSMWDAENTGAGSGSYALSETNTVPYQAVTAAMSKGADYQTKEQVNGNVVGAQCATGTPFALKGYTTGNTRTEAMNATPTMSKPAFTNLQSNKYVIVWNTDCDRVEGDLTGEVTGTNDGELEVTSIEMIDTSATANGSFADGWKYVFHITAPTSEENLAMKFDNWLRTGGSDTIPVSGNMRISSAQADNGGATILLTAANTHSTPDLHMTSDLNPGLIGRQVEITVEVAVPVGTQNGSYTTSYGVQSNP